MRPFLDVWNRFDVGQNWNWKATIVKGKFKELFSYLTRINQAWLHHTQAARESVSQEVLNATECLRGARKLKRERAHRRRIALCNCVKKLLLLLCSSWAFSSSLSCYYGGADESWSTSRPPQVDNDEMIYPTITTRLIFFLLFTWLCGTYHSVGRPVNHYGIHSIIQETMRSNAYIRSNDAIAWLRNETKALVDRELAFISNK